MEYLCHRAYRDIGNALQPRTPNFNVGANLVLELQSFVCHMPAEIPNPYIINIEIWGAGCNKKPELLLQGVVPQDTPGPAQKWTLTFKKHVQSEFEWSC